MSSSSLLYPSRSRSSSLLEEGNGVMHRALQYSASISFILRPALAADDREEELFFFLSLVIFLFPFAFRSDEDELLDFWISCLGFALVGALLD